jgi:hypothetical protein
VLEILIALFVLALVVPIGHGVWVALAALVRALAGRPATARPVRPEGGRRARCPGCEVCWVHPDDRVCPRCGLEGPERLAVRLAELAGVQREVRRLLRDEEIGPQAAERIDRLFEQRRRVLLGAHAAPAAPVPSGVEVRPQQPPAPAVPVLREAIRAEDIPEVLPVAEPAPAAHAPAPAIPAPAPTVPAPAVPRRRLADMLAAFMEERNILWGELVGGLLVVGCSLALVLTLWRSLERLPYFPFLTFSALTAGLFGAGKYTLHHWKLPATSRGLLIIALLLVPLNVLVLADPSVRGAGAPGWLDPIVAGAALLLFAGLVWSAGRDLIGEGLLPGPIDRRWLLVLAVLGTAAVPLVGARLPGEGRPAAFLLLGSLSVLCQAGATAAAVAACGFATSEPLSRKRLTGRQAGALLAFVGLGAFALLTALASLLTRAGDPMAARDLLAVPLTVAGGPVLAAGLLIHRRLSAPTRSVSAGTEHAAQASAEAVALAGAADSSGGLRAAGTATALAGLLVMLVGIGLAWPQPLALLAACGFAGVTLTVVGYRVTPAAHAGSLACLAFAAVLGLPLLAGRLPASPGVDAGAWLAELLTSSRSGAVLAVVALLLAGLAEGLARRERAADAAWHAGTAAGLALLGLLTVTWHGVERPLTAALVHGLCILGLLASNVRWQRRGLAAAAGWLVLPGSLWALRAAWPGRLDLWALTVGLEALALALLTVGLRSRDGSLVTLRSACTAASGGAGLLAAGLALWAPGFPHQAAPTYTAAALALTAFVLAGRTGWPALTWVGSLLGLAGLAHLTVYNIPAGALSLPLVVALAGHATAALLLAAAVVSRRERFEGLFAGPLRQSAQVTSLLAVLFLLAGGPELSLVRAGDALWLALLWLALAWLERSPNWFTAFQAGASAAVVFAVTAWLKQQPWLAQSSLYLGDPRALQAFGIGLGLLALVWVALRRAARNRPRLAVLIAVNGAALDWLMLGALVFAQLLLAVTFVIPDVVAELTPEGFVPPLTAPEIVHAHGVGAWLLLGLLTVALLATLAVTADCDGAVRGAAVVGLVLLLLTAPVLWAGTHAADVAAASALRWGMGACFLFGSALVWLRGPLGQLASELRLGAPVARAAEVRGMLLAAAGVVLALTEVVAQLGFHGQSPSGPIADSSFGHLGWVVSNVTPLAMLVAGLAGTALRERSSVYAFGGGLVANATVVGGCALAIVTRGGSIGDVEIIDLALLGCSTAAVWGLAWLACVWVGRSAAPSYAAMDVLLGVQTVLGLCVLAVLAALPLAALVIQPGLPLTRAFEPLGRGGWVVLLVSAAAALGYCRTARPRGFVHVVAPTALVAGVLAACDAIPWDAPRRCLSFHVLAAGWSLPALAAAAAALLLPERFASTAARRWLEVLGVALLLLALRGAGEDPLGPLPGAGAALVAAVLFSALGVRLGDGQYRYLSGMCMTGAGFIVWWTWGPHTLPGLLLTVGITLGLASAFWTAVELARPAGAPETRFLRWRWAPFAHQAALLALGLVILAGAIDLIGDLAGARVAPRFIDVAAMNAVGLALAVALWDRGARFALPGLYVLGLAAVGLALRLPTLAPWPLHAAGVLLALFAGAAGLLACVTERRSAWPRLLALPPRSPESIRAWFIPAQAVVAALCVVLSAAASVTGDGLVLRLTGPLAILLLLPAAVGVPELAGSGQQEPPEPGTPSPGAATRPAALALGAVLLGELAWAWPDAAGGDPWLQRCAWLLAALALWALACAEGLAPRLPAAWADAARRVGACVAGLAALLVPLLLLQGAVTLDPHTRHTALTGPALVASLVALAVLVGLALRWAVVEQSDPLRLSQRGRGWYVYAAEVLLLLAFVQLRLNVPELFSGLLARYWTLLVMLLAFLGVGLSEWCERRGPAVLAGPLQRTGVFLPIIPLLAFWAHPPQALLGLAEDHASGLRPLLGPLGSAPAQPVSHALLWFLASGLYATVALSRRSYRWVLAAALAANFGVWVLLAQAGVGFLTHPQAWLIPLALIVLVSEHLNRGRLRPELAGGLRYLGLSMIYVASTADLFIAGVGNSVWLPVVLAILAVFGVLAGIVLRVKAFLFLGVAFLLVDVLTMIWYAAVERAHTWVWWAAGVLLGLAILALFAVFEKRRNDVLRLVEKVRHWA